MDQCKGLKTKLGANLLDVIQSGVANLDSGVGVYAPDAESYTLFKPLFDPIIQVVFGCFRYLTTFFRITTMDLDLTRSSRKLTWVRERLSFCLIWILRVNSSTRLVFDVGVLFRFCVLLKQVKISFSGISVQSVLD